MEYKELYKCRPITSLSAFLAKHPQNLGAERQEKRREFFWGSRVLLETTPAKPQRVEKKKNTRAEMLQRWKAEKLKRLEEEKKKQKPVFKVGIVQRKVTGSPLINQTKLYNKKNIGVQQMKAESNSEKLKKPEVLRRTKTKNMTLKSNFVDVKPESVDAELIKPGVLTRAKARNMTVKSKFVEIKPESIDAELRKPRVLTRAKAKNLSIKPTFAELKPVVKTQKVISNSCYIIEEGKKKQMGSNVFRVPEVVSKLPSSSLTLPYSPKLMRRGRKSMKFMDEKDTMKETKIQELDEIKPIELDKQVKLRSREQVKNMQEESAKKQESTLQPQKVTPEKAQNGVDDFIPIYYSPFVTVRSGKKSKRKSKKSLIIDVDEQIKKEENEFKCRIFSFRKYIECEAKRLLDMCDKWKHIYEEFQEVPADVEGDIDSAIGKTNLLTSDKFMQFKGLIDKCENGDPFVKVDDLQGFQDWVSIEVEKIDEEFHKLEKRKGNNWILETAPPNVVKAPKVGNAKKEKKKPMGKSNIRSHILAARKLLQDKNVNGGEISQLLEVKFELAVKAKTPKKKQSLLKDVLNLEWQKKNESSAKKSPIIRERRNSGLEIMIASQKNKFPTPSKLQKSPLLTDFEIFLGKQETPSRTILKKTPKTLSSSKGHVTFKNLSENSFRHG